MGSSSGVNVALEAGAGAIHLNVKDYGATGDGTTDDTTAIQAALDASSAGDTIYFPRGTYITTGVTFAGNRIIRGTGANTGGASMLKQKDSTNGDGVLLSDGWKNNNGIQGPVVIRDLTIDGNKANNSSGHGIVLLNHNSIVENVRIRDCKSNGVHLPDTTKNGTAPGSNLIENHLVRLKVATCDGHGIATADTNTRVTDGWVVDCVVNGCAGDGIHIEKASGWVVRGNHFYNVEKNAILVDAAKHTSVVDNYVESYGNSATVGTYSAVKATATLGDGAVNIIGNRIKNANTTAGNTFRSMNLQGASGVNAYYVVQGNFLELNGAEDAIYSFSAGGGGAVLLTITGNYIIDEGQALNTALTGVHTAGNNFNYQAAAPTADRWPTGTVVWNTAPAAGGDPGWVCTSGGSPGTWKAMANIDA